MDYWCSKIQEVKRNSNQDDERQFMDLRIILMSHCFNEFLKKVLNFRFKLDGIVPRYGSTIKSSFSGTVGKYR